MQKQQIRPVLPHDHRPAGADVMGMSNGEQRHVCFYFHPVTVTGNR